MQAPSELSAPDAPSALPVFVATDESTEIIKHYTNISVFKLLWNTLKLTPRIWRSTRAMTKKWPWDPSETLMDRPLREIRADFGIEPFRPEVVLGLSE